MNKRITKTLKMMGVPQHIKGYQYMAYALELVLYDKELVHNISKRLYPMVAKRFNSTYARVERAIRHAVEISFNAIDPEVVNAVFGNSIPLNKDKPCNSHWIAAVAEMIEEEE